MVDNSSQDGSNNRHQGWNPEVVVVYRECAHTPVYNVQGIKSDQLLGSLPRLKSFLSFCCHNEEQSGLLVKRRLYMVMCTQYLRRSTYKRQGEEYGDPNHEPDSTQSLH